MLFYAAALQSLNYDWDTLTNPFEAAADHEEACHIAGAVSRLAPFYREVLFLRFQEDMKLNEIASLVGVPLSTVKARLYRTLDALRSSLGETQS